MRHRDFCFWLQGAFEICGPEALTEYQIEIIKQHIALVDESQSRVPRPSPHAGFFNAFKTIISDSGALHGDSLHIVKKLLNAEFVHIDANTEGDQDAMDHLHNTGRPPGGTPRC